MALDLSNKRVMVTGGAGFLGSFVLEKLAERGCTDVMVPRTAEFDLTKSAHVARALSAFEPEVVIHLAAVVGGIGANRDEPGRFFYDNAMMGIELIEQSRRFGIEKFVCIGTVCGYPKFAAVPFAEDGLWSGYPEETNAPYGIAKKAMLVQLQAYREQYGMNGIFLLPVNLYGPRDNFDLQTSHVIPAIIRKCVEAKERGDSVVTLWGTGAVSREFLYAADAAEGIVLATERYDDPDPVNLGAGFEIRISELAEKIVALTGFDGEIVWDTSQPDGQPRRSLDTRRAEEQFGFRATTGFDDGLARTVEWYLAEGRAGAVPATASPYLPPVEEIRDGEQVIAIIVRGSLDKAGVTFFSENDFSQQLGFISQPAGHVIEPHVHNAVPREVVYTQETLFVREGRVRVELYREDRSPLTSRVLTGGDAILLATGGHGFTMLDDTAMVEVKQGPYAGDGDKTRFEAAP
ncbi:MAG: NAD-dependent epimerase/dehydratase family protein [Coriobacteriia bacterium]|nr:NAD-dependent epimerase/dehydratase family protein [Coriobacteriia bacterium]